MIYLQKREGYEVIRLIERGSLCQASLDYAEGVSLYDWVKKNPMIDKSLLYRWLEELLNQLVLFHRQKGSPDYGRLNPYQVIIISKNRVALLARKAKENTRTLEKYFTPQDKSQNIDIYCFGKIIQFVMAHTECEPRLSKLEEYKLQRIVKKCLETNPKCQYRGIHEVQLDFTEKRKIKIDRKKGLVVSVLLIFLGGIGVIRGSATSNQMLQESKNQIKPKETEVRSQEKMIVETDEGKKREQQDLFLQLGMDSFLEQENYEQCISCMNHADIQNPRVIYYLKLAEFMKGDKTNTDWANLKSELEQELREEIQLEMKEMLAFLRICFASERQEEAKDFFETLKDSDLEKEKMGLSENLQREWEEYCAKIYEMKGEWKQALLIYEALYEKSQISVEKTGEYQKGITEMNIKYLEEIWQDSGVLEEKKVGEIGQIIARNPYIMKEEIFQNFVNEKKIHIEEGKIWVEKVGTTP